MRDPPVAAVEDVVPAVGAVVRERDPTDERILVVRDRASGEWTVPFGRVESGESVRETVRREVREEAAVDVTIDRLAGVYSAPDTQVFRHRSGRVLQFVVTFVVCSPAGDPDDGDGDPAPDGEETDRARYVTRDALPAMEPVDEWVRDALDGATTLR